MDFCGVAGDVVDGGANLVQRYLNIGRRER